MTALVEKDPDATKDYTLDWREWLAGDRLATSNWSADAGLVVTSSAISADEQQTTVWLASGTVDALYSVQNRITTDAGRSDDRTFLVRVVQQ